MIVLGGGGHAEAVAGVAVAGGNPVRRARFEDAWRPANHVIVGVGCSNMALRERIATECMEFLAPGLVHPTVWTPTSCMIERGTVVFPGAVLGTAARLGRNVVVYSGSVIEHDCVIDDHAWLSPGVILCGNVTVKAKVFIGAGAILLPGVTVYEGARIGAGAVVHQDVPAGATVYGPRHDPVHGAQF